MADDHFDPSERMPAVRARVPEHVAAGQISTGVIVVTGATEYVLDFVRNLPRPNMIVARVILPHPVMPQFIEALSTNINLYRQRFGEQGLGPMASGTVSLQDKPTPQLAASAGSSAGAGSSDSANTPVKPSASSAGGETGSEAANSASNRDLPESHNDAANQRPTAEGAAPPASSSVSRHASPQEVYDELKLKDELLSGTYANAVMIGHGPHEFCFDFITNFYPQSAVSCRVFMSSGHIGRLLESLRASWDQLRPRLGGNS
jgi:hypothetical protein